ncbi:hypothetical protein BSKO_04934 [Bryopsis sp. KO-2023]|nr:hypothetical protein BSKO_04934 [Bryopsis sp. KO-2023]
MCCCSFVCLVDLVTVIFFSVHAATSVLIDAQALLPAESFPPWAVELLRGYLEKSGDPLMSHTPVWFKSMVFSELAFQVPFFIVAVFAMLARKEWIRIPCIIYGAHTVTTMIPILYSLISPALEGPVEYDLPYLMQNYVPFAVMPAVIMIRWCFGGKPFGGRSKSSYRRGQKLD